MPSSDLISLARARQAISQATWSAADETLLAVAITSASGAARAWCHSPLALAAVEEIRQPQRGDGLRCRSLPARAVLRVASDPGPGLALSAPAGGSVRLTPGVIEWGVGAGPVRTVVLASHATLAALAVALIALEPSLVVGVVAPAASPADLACTGARLPLSGSPLVLTVYRQAQSGWRLLPGLGALVWSCPWLITGEVRLVVLAGHEPLPVEVEEAVAQWAATLYWRMRGQTSGLVGDEAQPPAGARALLAPWRVFSIGEPDLKAREWLE